VFVFEPSPPVSEQPHSRSLAKVSISPWPNRC
jgi:hypothetical protein